MSGDHRYFIDCLRGSLGLPPLYCQRAPGPPFVEQQFGTLDHPAALVSASTPVQAEARITLGDHYSRLDGRRVGTVFRDRPAKLGWKGRVEREAEERPATSPLGAYKGTGRAP